MNFSDPLFMVPGCVIISSYDYKYCKILKIIQVFYCSLKALIGYKMAEESNQIALFLQSDSRNLCIEIKFKRNSSRYRNTTKFFYKDCKILEDIQAFFVAY